MHSLKYLFVGTIVAAAMGANAQGYHTQYDVTLNYGSPVTNIMLLESNMSFSALTWAFNASGEGTTSIYNPFPTAQPTESALLVGIVKDLPNDAPGQKHVVLMMDDNAASLVNHIAWGTIFRTTQEEQLISDIELATSGQDWPIIQPGLDGVNTFGQGESKTILGPGGFTSSAWFNVGGSFSVMAFSDGQLIGSGTSSVTFTPVPEPASMGVVGLGIVALLRRRSRK